MKGFLAFVFSIFTIGAAVAQEKTIEIKINGEAASMEIFWKASLLIFFILLILILALRTFRGKADV